MMKRNTVILIAFMYVTLLDSCASLTKSQLTEVNQFGQLTKNFSVCPTKIVNTLVDVQVQNQFFQSAIIEDPEKHRKSVVTIYEFMQTSSKLDDEISVILQIVGDYGQKLVRLSSDFPALQLDTAAQAMGSNLDNLLTKYNSLEPQHTVPTGIGALFGKLISFGGEMYIHDRQATGIKEFVTRGDAIITTLTERLENVLQSNESGNLKDRLSHEREVIDRNFKAYLAVDNEAISLYFKSDTTYKKNQYRRSDIVAKKDTVITGALRAWRSNAMEADRLYLQLMVNLDAAETLRQQCLLSVKNLQKAHHKLMEDLQQWKNLKELYAELHDYGTSVGQMYSTLKKIK